MMIQTADAAEQASADGKTADERLWVTFYKHPFQDEAASEQEGRPIFRDLDYIKIVIPGNQYTVIERPVRAFEYAGKPADRKRFPKQWLAYQTDASQEEATGTPLDAWPAVTRAQVEEMKYFGVRTVEQLAGMSDTHAQKYMGIVTLRDRARAFLAAAKEAAPVAAMQAELAKRDSDMEMLRAALKDQGDQLAELRAASTPKHKAA